MTIYDIPFSTLTGAPATLAAYKGKVLLLVNVASRCGLTPQYEALEKLYESRREEGLVVIGFPSNDFGGQEPGTSEEIARFCTATFGVQFPMADKMPVTGPHQHPLYAHLTTAQPVALEHNPGAFEEKLAGYGHHRSRPQDVLWNFEKFLIARDGAVVARFNPDVRPDDALVVEAITRELDKR
ncbi:glutathione peroxidase [Massilia putida]|uniref:glutathione peroxidase n=1 Tax=Massilia putida TaxID=1141883 RepID=UPI0009520D38|nr:glutathione peroxidase [Massilia putida]